MEVRNKNTSGDFLVTHSGVSTHVWGRPPTHFHVYANVGRGEQDKVGKSVARQKAPF